MLVIVHEPCCSRQRQYASSSVPPCLVLCKILRSQPTPQRQHQMQRRPALKVILRSHLIICPRAHHKPPFSKAPLFPVTTSLGGGLISSYICFPPKINRCCTGGMPSFSSTRSLMRETLWRRGVSFSWGHKTLLLKGG